MKKYNHGITLVKCIVLSTGYFSKLEIIRSIVSDADSKLINFLSLNNNYLLNSFMFENKMIQNSLLKLNIATMPPKF